MAALQSVGNAVGALAASFIGGARLLAGFLSALLVATCAATSHPRTRPAAAGRRRGRSAGPAARHAAVRRPLYFARAGLRRLLHAARLSALLRPRRSRHRGAGRREAAHGDPDHQFHGRRRARRGPSSAAQRPARQAPGRDGWRGRLHRRPWALHRHQRIQRGRGGDAGGRARVGHLPGSRLGHRLPGASPGGHGDGHGDLEHRHPAPPDRCPGHNPGRFAASGPDRRPAGAPGGLWLGPGRDPGRDRLVMAAFSSSGRIIPSPRQAG